MTEKDTLLRPVRVASRHSHDTFAIRLLWVLIGALVTLTVLHLLLQHLNLNIFYQHNGQVYELSNRFDFDDESSVPTWFSHLLFLGIGVSALSAAWLHKSGALRRLWLLVGVAGLAAAIDEIATLHEFVLQSLHIMYYQDASPTATQNAWAIVAPFVLAAFGWVAWRMWRLLPRRTFILLVISGVIFLFGAMGIDLLTSISARETFWHQGLYVAAEESMELLGCILALSTIVDYIERRSGPNIREALYTLGVSRR